jgi:hypothetical protein
MPIYGQDKEFPMRTFFGKTGCTTAMLVGIVILVVSMPASPEMALAGPRGSAPQGAAAQLPPECYRTLNPTLLYGNPNFLGEITKCLIAPAWGQAGGGGPPWTSWPDPYKWLAQPPPEQCRPYLSDWRKFEKCLLVKMHYPHDFPKLMSGKFDAWGRSNPGYNCYAFAAAPYDPLKTWVGGGSSQMSYDEFIEFFTNKGWKRAPLAKTQWIFNNNAKPQVGEERVVIFKDPVTQSPLHAAFWDSRGILAKMGEFGVFRFENLDQMVGPLYGRPREMFRNGEW